MTVDVVVVGGGNAALCAALSARDAGASVLLLERSDRWDRGGNSRHTRNLRCVREGATASTTYAEDELFSDLVGVTGPGFEEDLARMTIARSREAPAWMEAHGVRWQPALRGTLQLDRTNRFFLGGGKALVNAYYERAEASGVQIRYHAKVDRLCFDGDTVRSVVVGEGGAGEEIACRAVVVASGGFESNIEWLRRYWGDAADNYRIRGTPHNDGHVLARLFDAGALPRGNERGFHAIAVDARAPKFDGGIVTRVDSITLGIVVDRDARRFYDEGEEIWPKRYASWGKLIAQQPDQIAYSIFDSKASGAFIPCAYPPYSAGSIGELATRVGLDAAALDATVREYNAAAHADGTYSESGRKDGRATRGLAIPKSNWALRIDTAPYYATPLRPGITFTYLGVAVDDRARVLRSGGAFANVFAAGEIVAGNILRNGYLAGFGMTIGTVFGRIAGEEAARVR